jgi:hypothetical protein
MNFKELRIGNIIESGIIERMDIGDCIYSMQIIDFEGVRRKISNPSPLPITKEWLMRFGYQEHEDGFIILLNEITGMILEKSIYEDIGIAFDLSFLQNDGHCILLEEVQFVHQLQNIYFALTDEELKLLLLESKT